MKTAIETFIEYLTGVGFVFSKEDVEKALREERQQIIDAHSDGYNQGLIETGKHGEDYYTQTSPQ